jgi:hypothetical protein
VALAVEARAQWGNAGDAIDRSFEHCSLLVVRGGPSRIGAVPIPFIIPGCPSAI